MCLVKLVVVLLVLALSTPLRAEESACQISDCSLASGSNCSWINSGRMADYIAVQNTSLTTPPPNNPEHLFNLLQDPRHSRCIYMSFFVRGGILKLGVQCSSIYNSFSEMSFQVKFNQSSGHCIERSSLTKKRAEKCGIFANEQLKLTFLGDDEHRLLLEDLSGMVPAGTSLLLQKMNPAFDKQCECPNLIMFLIKKQSCIETVLK